MNQKSILVVEDDPVIGLDICATLEAAGYNIFGRFMYAEQAQEALATSSVLPDAAIFDINLHGITDAGITLARSVNELYDFPFVFLTSYTDKKTLENAFSVAPASYIVKPFEPDDLVINIELALYKQLKYTGTSSRTEVAATEEPLYLKSNQKLVKVMPADIWVVQAIDNYSFVFTGGEKHMLSRTLKSMAEKLGPLGFRRVHKSYLVNPSHIEYIQDDVIVMGEHRVPIGRLYRDEIFGHIRIL